MRWRRIVVAMAFLSGGSALALACSTFDGTDGDGPPETGVEGSSLDGTSDAALGTQDAADGVAWECDGSLAAWDMTSTSPPSPLMEFEKNSGVTLVPLSDEAGPFGRFTETFEPLEAGSIYRVNVTVDDATTDVCMSMRIRHIAFGPAAAAVDEIGATLFTVGASYGFAQLVQVRTLIETLQGFGDSTMGSPRSFEDASILSGDATKWVTWRLEGHRETTGGFRFRLLENGRVVMNVDPFPADAPALNGAFGFGPHSAFTSADASAAIVDFANVRIDRLPN